MKDAMILNLYLPEWKRDDLARGDTLFGHIAAEVQQADWQVIARDHKEVVGGPGFHLVYNRAVEHPRCLTVRRCYMDPFFRIERTNDRWDWQVARTDYPGMTGGDWFRRYWVQHLFRGHDIHQGGYVFMPLQGRLLDHRSFQSMSPVEMIHAALAADPGRDIRATLHPRESYSDSEMQALAAIGGRFSLVQDPSMAVLAGCDYVVTQNSGLALIGMFAKKTPVLFSEIDFHHIAPSVPKQGVQAAYAGLQRPRDWGNYLHWFFRDQALSTRAAGVRARLRALGWPI